MNTRATVYMKSLHYKIGEGLGITVKEIRKNIQLPAYEQY